MGSAEVGDMTVLLISRWTTWGFWECWWSVCDTHHNPLSLIGWSFLLFRVKYFFLYLILCIVWKVLWCSRVAVSPVPVWLITFHTDHGVRRAERQEACIIFQLFRFYPSEAAVIRVDLRGMKWRHIRRCCVTNLKSLFSSKPSGVSL